MTSRSNRLALATLLAIVAAAVFLRFFDLAANPGGLYGDEASEGLDALKLLHQPGFHADWLVWFQDDGGREALFAYVVAAAFHVFGETTLVLRGTAAAFGVAGVLAVALVGRRFGTWIGIVAAAWTAGALWLVCVSRDGMRNTIVPLFAALAFIALMRWAARPGRGTAVLAGAATAIGSLYTYQPLKLFPLLIVLWLIWLRHADRRRFDDLLAGAIPFGAAFLIVGAPMLAVAVTNPISFFGRATVVSAFNPGSAADSDLPTHILRTFAMFGFLGDQNGRHDVAALPLLPLPLVAVAALGVARMWRLRRDAAVSLVLIGLPVFLLPPLIATEGYSPHFLRSLGLAVPVALTIGFGAAELVELTRARWGPWAGRASISVVAVGLAALAVWSGAVYFSRSVADRYEAYSYQVTAMGEYAAAHPGSAVIIDGFSATDIRFVYYYDLPAIFEPNMRIPNPSAYSTVLAGTRDALSRALGSDASARARPVNWDPSGKPDVWAVNP